MVKRIIRALLPSKLYAFLLLPYHFCITLLSACYYRFPAQQLTIILVTGTKGKSTVSSMISSILTTGGISHALSNTVHFKINDIIEKNLFKMTVPGKGFLQKFLRKAVNAGCTHAVIEMSSEATLNFRHLFLAPNIVVVTNLQPEHLERHGGMENYFRAKFAIVHELEISTKRERHLFVGTDDEYGTRFLKARVPHKHGYSVGDVHISELTHTRSTFIYDTEEYTVALPGEVSVKNALATIHVGLALQVSIEAIKRGLLNLKIPGRFERVEAGQDFDVIIDYAHTPDSLKALYAAYPARKICVLGNTGGGRDSWKRPSMGKIADEHCDVVILTNEDPYDEDPRKIIDAMTSEMKRTPHIIMDRREAIREAVRTARASDAVLISGKGTDPYIMGPNDTKVPWSDAEVAEEELKKMLS